MEENKMQTGQRKPAFGESRGIVKDYQVDKTTYRYRGATEAEIAVEKRRIEKAAEGTRICPYCGTTHESSLCSFVAEIVYAIGGEI